jgi:hypothetical protein
MIQNDDISAEPRLITPAPVSKQEEVMERALRPKQLDEYVGRRKYADSWKYSFRLRKIEVNRSTMCCCLVHLVWVRPRWRKSSHARWA